MHFVVNLSTPWRGFGRPRMPNFLEIAVKFAKIVLSSICLSVVAFSCHAGGELNTRFEGWLGKNQKGHYLDTSNWHYCFNNEGGSCGSVALNTGSSTCHTTGFNIGTKWAVPTRVGGLEINSGFNKSWTACNVRSETVTCSPNRGWKGRAVINFSERWGRVRVLGGETYFQRSSQCPAGWKSEWMGGPSWRCTYTGGQYTRDGYLPEWRGSSCNYQRI